MISVIVATYNREKYINKAIKSVFCQSYKNVEIIVVDDGSTDNTKEKLLPYIKSSQLKYIYQKNQGSFSARDTGIKNSSGDYIAILDSDDEWIDKDKLKKQADFLENNKDYMLVGGGAIIFDEYGKEIYKVMPPETDKKIRQVLLFNNMFCHSSVLFRKSAWVATGGYMARKGNVVGDWNLWLKMGKLGKFYNFQQYFVRYLFGSQNTSFKKFRDNLRWNIVMRKQYRHDYPNYFRAIAFGYIRYLFSFLPFNKKIRTLFLKARDR